MIWNTFIGSWRGSIPSKVSCKWNGGDVVRAVVQRVDWANVRVGEEMVGEVGLGMCVLLGVSGRIRTPM